MGLNPEIFIELSLILIITVIITGIVSVLRQPAIIGYILSGIVAGPLVLDIISSTDTLTAFSQIGIALLLFLVGLNLNPKVIKDVGKISLVTGLGQVLFTTSIGFGIAKLLGLSTTVALYVGIALAFSSTIVIMKLLSDKRDLDSLYGRISVGFLIIQDFIAIAILLVISSLNAGVNLTTLAVQTLLKGIGGVLILFVLTLYVLPYVTKKIAKSQEFLLLFSLSWCFAVASAFHYLNFSIEAGALLAGIALSMSPYHFEISSRTKPLRDFFLVLFFIVLGSQMMFANIIDNIWLIVILSLFVLIGNPIIVMTLMGLFGYTKRSSFLAGLTVAQISEFSLILITMGVTVGHLNGGTLSIITAVALLTFAGSTYMILYSDKLYNFLAPYLSIFERKGRKVDQRRNANVKSYDILLFGYNRIGLDILESLGKIKKKFLVIDYDPDVINNLTQKDLPCMFGDANDSELLSELNFRKTKMVISTIPDIDTNLLLMNHVRAVNKKTIIALVSHSIEDATRLYDEGATYVIMPHFLGGKHFSTMIEKNKLSVQKFLKEKISHLNHINHRKEQGHDHPRHLRK